MPRFSLKTLLIAAAVVPVAIYALDNVTRGIAIAALNLVLSIGAVALVISLEAEGERRIFARGFLAVAVAYAVVSYLTDSNDKSSIPLVTTALLDMAYKQTVIYPPRGPVKTMPVPEYRPFMVVGQIYWSVLFGLIGGWSAGWLYHRRQKANQPRTEASNNP